MKLQELQMFDLMARLFASVLLLPATLMMFALQDPATAQSSKIRHDENRPCRAVSDGSAVPVTFETYPYQGETTVLEALLVSARKQPISGDTVRRPAVILLPTYFGMQPPECYQWIQKHVRAWGYHSLLIDHASAGAFEGPRGFEHSVYDRMHDLERALVFLQARQEVDPGRIAVIGWSQGARTLLTAATSNRAFTDVDRLPFSAAVAFYPTCPRDVDRLRTPLMLLHGTADKDAPIDSCRAMMVDLAASGSAMKAELVEYEQAGHLFDHPDNSTLDAAAAGDALDRVQDFLALHFGEEK